MSNPTLDAYDQAAVSYEEAAKVKQIAYEELNDVATYLCKLDGPWGFFTSLDSYRIGKITDMIPDVIPYRGLQTPVNRRVQVFRAGGMGDYDAGMDLYDKEIGYNLSMHAPTIESYQSKVKGEVVENIYGLSEIAANGIPVYISVSSAVKLLLTPVNVSEICATTLDELDTLWEESKNRSLDYRRKRD